MMQILALSDVAPQPWKNGGGLTHELLAWPAADGWRVRISVAEVAQSGPFSAYPGIARWFVVLQGAGVVLHFASGPRKLLPGHAPLHFDGGAAPGCDLVDGPTLDLNLLADANAGRSVMHRVRAGAAWTDAARLRAVFTARPATLLVGGEVVAQLPALSLAWTEHAAEAPWRLADDGTPPQAWWMAFQPHRS